MPQAGLPYPRTRLLVKTAERALFFPDLLCEAGDPARFRPPRSHLRRFRAAATVTVSGVQAEGETARRLQAELDFARALVEITQSLVCVLDRDSRIVEFNRACELATGYSSEEAIGRRARELVIPPEERELFDDLLVRIWKTGKASPERGHWLTRDGDRREIEWANQPLKDETGAVTHLVCTGLDVTEREQATAEVLRLAEEQAALRRVATLVAAEARPEDLFEAVAEEAGRLLGVKSAATVRYVENTAITVGRWSESALIGFPVGTELPMDGDGVTARVHRTGTVARVEDYTDLEGAAAEAMRAFGYRSAVAAPIVVEGRTWGALIVASSAPEPLPDDAERRIGNFAELIALAVASAQAREQLNASRARLVEAGVVERRRLERNLHDGAQQRLVGLSLQLRLARARAETEPAEAVRLIAAAEAELDAALEELRELARGLHPGTLTYGLGPALDALVARAPFAVTVEGVPDERLPETVEAAVYYVIAEALTNAAKHAGATRGHVRVAAGDGTVSAEVADNGRGGVELGVGSGIQGLVDRVEALGGRLEILSPAGEGTVVRAMLPLT